MVWQHSPDCTDRECYCTDPEDPDPICDCGNPGFACCCKNDKEENKMKKIFCAPVSNLGLMFAGCYVAWVEGDSQQYIGDTETDALGHCVKTLFLNFGPISFTYEFQKEPVRYVDRLWMKETFSV